MKREILCRGCTEEFQLKKYPEEQMKLVYGTAKHDYLCDSCADPIVEGRHCSCVSYWSTTSGIQYYPWEDDYIYYLGEKTTEGT